MNKITFLIFVAVFMLFFACEKSNDPINENTSDEITIDSLVANFTTVRAWDTTTITCYASGQNLVYAWEADHGNFNGEGHQIKYAAGECCVGVNTITCTLSNETGQLVENIQIKVTSYFEKNNKDDN